MPSSSDTGSWGGVHTLLWVINHVLLWHLLAVLSASFGSMIQYLASLVILYGLGPEYDKPIASLVCLISRLQPTVALIISAIGVLDAFYVLKTGRYIFAEFRKQTLRAVFRPSFENSSAGPHLTQADRSGNDRALPAVMTDQSQQTDPTTPPANAPRLIDIERQLLDKTEEMQKMATQSFAEGLKIKDLERQVGDRDNVLSKLTHKVNCQKTAVDGFEATRNKLNEELARLRLDREELSALCNQLKADNAQIAQQSTKKLEACLAERDSAFLKLKVELSQAEASRQDLTAQLSALKKKFVARTNDIEASFSAQELALANLKEQACKQEQELQGALRGTKSMLTVTCKNLEYQVASNKNLIAQLSSQKEDLERTKADVLSITGKLKRETEKQDAIIGTTVAKKDSLRLEGYWSSKLESHKLFNELEQVASSDIGHAGVQRHVQSRGHLVAKVSSDEGPTRPVLDTVPPAQLPTDVLKEWASHDRMFLTGRVRPMSQEEKERNLGCCVERGEGSNTIMLKDPKAVANTSSPDHVGLVSGFDRIFWPEDPNADVYHAFAYLVAGFIQGYNVGIVSDGPSGSGKTHTMLKGEGALIATAIHEILKFGLRDGEVLKVRAIEVYKEKLRDIVGEVQRSREVTTEAIPPSQRAGFRVSPKSAAAGWESSTVLTFDRNDKFQHIAEVCKDFDKKRINRDTAMNSSAGTADNAGLKKGSQSGSSSRGHLVVIITIGGEAEERTRGRGRLTFLDLAGTEIADENDEDTAQEYKDIRKDRSDCYNYLAQFRDRNTKQPYSPQRLLGHLIKNLFEGGKELKLAHIFHFAPSNHGLNSRLIPHIKRLSKIDMSNARPPTNAAESTL